MIPSLAASYGRRRRRRSKWEEEEEQQVGRGGGGGGRGEAIHLKESKPPNHPFPLAPACLPACLPAFLPSFHPLAACSKLRKEARRRSPPGRRKEARHSAPASQSIHQPASQSTNTSTTTTTTTTTTTIFDDIDQDESFFSLPLPYPFILSPSLTSLLPWYAATRASLLPLSSLSRLPKFTSHHPPFSTSIEAPPISPPRRPQNHPSYIYKKKNVHRVTPDLPAPPSLLYIFILLPNITVNQQPPSAVMANGLDRLERLFAYKRKASPGPNRQSTAVAQPPEPQFPSPSFIRPKTTRMAAREEVRLRTSEGRSPSVPDIITALRTHPQMPDSAIDEPKTSISSRQTDSFLSEFDSSSFSEPLYTPSTDGPQLPSPRSFSPCQVAPPPSRLATPPSSDVEDSGLFLSDLSAKAMQPRVPPTPEDTPDFGPVGDAHITDQATSKSSLYDIVDSFDQLSLHRSYSQSSITPSARLSFCSSTLREPDFDEFLKLSDDDIAELAPPSPIVSPVPDSKALPPMGLSISSTQPFTPSLLTLTPPRTSRPAAAAAFLAARVALHFDFDLIYVVNLWPDSIKTEMNELAAQGQHLAPRPMMGRLLAAHGLHHVPSPLQISSHVHTTILRSDGWIEYRNQDAQNQDLARGFACAFYTGQYARNGQADSRFPVSGVRLSEQIDRGIVFAAYRKPRFGPDRLGRNFSEEELGKLHQDAETMVEMLIDIHVASRKRQPLAQSSSSDDTGPMPLQVS
ncbi:hypothetical protein L249_3419, partial [Ophiocordyceps polyrhachis-furcata BCC 54312]